MTEFLLKRFVKNHEDVDDLTVREAYGVLASTVSILCNALLFGGKFFAGIIMGSVSVMADAFNNLSDAGACVIELIGVRLAVKPADEEHPFGHGRIEYIAALVISFLVLEVGLTFLKDSIVKIKSPVQMEFKLATIVILLVSICVKLWMAIFNRSLGRKIGSKVMEATATDAIGDIITTSAVILSILVWKFTGFNVDGYVGIVVSLVVMWAGFGIAKDTIAPLIGEAATPEDYVAITQFVEGYIGIEGTHDLIVHDYGPGRKMASIHAEVPNDVDVEVSHEIIDRIERDMLQKRGIFLVIHMDPVETKDETVLLLRDQVVETLASIDSNSSIHDFRTVVGKNQINLIFDMVVPHEYDKMKQTTLKNELCEKLQEIDHRYQCVITVERSYVASAR